MIISRQMIETNPVNPLDAIRVAQDRAEVARARRDDPWGWLEYPLTIGEAWAAGLLDSEPPVPG